MEAIDKIRGHGRCPRQTFLGRSYGQRCGFIALETGIAGGAELILLPETLTDVEDVKNAERSFPHTA